MNELIVKAASGMYSDSFIFFTFHFSDFLKLSLIRILKNAHRRWKFFWTLYQHCCYSTLMLYIWQGKDSRLEITFSFRIFQALLHSLSLRSSVAIWGSCMPFSFLNLCMCPVVFSLFSRNLFFFIFYFL